MTVEPIELWLDRQSLRRGLIVPVHPETDPSALLIQDSGMVPVSTQICIVNPESNRLCLVGEFGEIWVQSEANVHSFYASKDPLDADRFNGRTIDGDPNVRYVRTGDLGFLHNVTRNIGPSGGLVDMQVLFVLGNVGETFEVNGLCHFPVDIEISVEKCHRNIVPGGCAVFQAGGLAVVLVEVDRKQWLASIVPVIVNSVLNNHNFVVDIVAFVSKGDFPRSRLGEKQRGKILASWVTRKMRTVAQFAIQDPSVDEPEYGHRRRASSGVGPRGSASSATLHSGHVSSGSRGAIPHIMPRQSGEFQNVRESMSGPPAGVTSVQQPYYQSPTVQNPQSQYQASSPQDPTMLPPPLQPKPHMTAQDLPQNEFHAELPATYPAPEELISELPGDDLQITPTVSRRISGMHRIQEFPGSEERAAQLSYSPIDVDGPFASGSSPFHTLAPKESYPSLAKAAQGLPGGLLPPGAISDLKAAASADAKEAAMSQYSDGSLDDTAAYPPPLPSYINKPYLSMLSTEEGREGTLPSPPRASGQRSSEEGIRPFTGQIPNFPTFPSSSQIQSNSTNGRGKIGNRDSTFAGGDSVQWPTEEMRHMAISGPPATNPAVRRKNVGSSGSGNSLR
jgi:hypothetical protein